MKKSYDKIDKIHSYPAKYTIEMIKEYIEKYSEKGETVLDPFVGSGTSLLASKMLERNSYGFDINPVAYIVSKVKTNNYKTNLKKDIDKFIKKVRVGFNEIDNINYDVFFYEGINHWFEDNVINILSYIRYCINNYENKKMLKELYYLAFSHIILPASNQESDTRYSAKNKTNISDEKIINMFAEKVLDTFDVLTQISNSNKIKAKVYLKDARLIKTSLKKESVSLLITSPPYPNTYDYYLYHKHRITWLGYDFKPIMESEIGSRREFSSLKKSGDKFTSDLYQIFSSANYSLKKGAYIVIIIGDGKISGKMYNSNIEIKKIAKILNWEIIEEKNTELDKTSKSFRQSFRTKGKLEHYIVFKKQV